MTAEKNLQKLLATMSPLLLEGRFVFCSFENARYGDRSELEPIAAVTESEGLTLVIPKSKADENGLTYDAVFSCITLMCHSSLEAVGLTAVVSKTLTENGISANILAGYFHDHVFVPAENAKSALAVLGELSNDSQIG